MESEFRKYQEVIYHFKSFWRKNFKRSFGSGRNPLCCTCTVEVLTFRQHIIHEFDGARREFRPQIPVKRRGSAALLHMSEDRFAARKDVLPLLRVEASNEIEAVIRMGVFVADDQAALHVGGHFRRQVQHIVPQSVNVHRLFEDVGRVRAGRQTGQRGQITTVAAHGFDHKHPAPRPDGRLLEPIADLRRTVQILHCPVMFGHFSPAPVKTQIGRYESNKPIKSKLTYRQSINQPSEQTDCSQSFNQPINPWLTLLFIGSANQSINQSINITSNGVCKNSKKITKLICWRGKNGIIRFLNPVPGRFHWGRCRHPSKSQCPERCCWWWPAPQSRGFANRGTSCAPPRIEGLNGTPKTPENSSPLWKIFNFFFHQKGWKRKRKHQADWKVLQRWAQWTLKEFTQYLKSADDDQSSDLEFLHIFRQRIEVIAGQCPFDAQKRATLTVPPIHVSPGQLFHLKTTQSSPNSTQKTVSGSLKWNISTRQNVHFHRQGPRCRHKWRTFYSRETGHSSQKSAPRRWCHHTEHRCTWWPNWPVKKKNFFIKKRIWCKKQRRTKRTERTKAMKTMKTNEQRRRTHVLLYGIRLVGSLQLGQHLVGGQIAHETATAELHSQLPIFVRHGFRHHLGLQDRAEPFRFEISQKNFTVLSRYAKPFFAFTRELCP